MHPAGDYQHGNAKALRDDPEPMQQGTLDTDYIKHLPETIRHGFIKHLPRLRDHTARNTAGDPAPIRKGHAAGKIKPSSETTPEHWKKISFVIGDRAGIFQAIHTKSARTETGTE